MCCPLAVCQERDPKGIYAAHGESGTVPGVGADYEPPLQPETVIDTTHNAAAESATLVLAKLQHFVLGNSPAAG